MAERDAATALRELEEASRLFSELGQPYDEARSLEALGVALRGAHGGDRHQSRAASRQAAAIYGRLGAAPDSDRLASLTPSGKVAGRSVS